MAREFSKKFYKSKAWEQCRHSYIKSVHALCERCGRPGRIVHHKIKLTSENINKPHITLNHDNLELVCLECHNKDEFGEHKEKSKSRYEFDKNGNILPPSEIF